MVSANPFRGLRFDPAVIGDPGLVIAPPYDVVTPEARDAYEAASPYNMVRVVLASVPLDADRRWVLPHERTMAAPVADRLRLLEATSANLSPVFGLYAAKGRTAAAVGAMMAGPPAIECTDEVG